MMKKVTLIILLLMVSQASGRINLNLENQLPFQTSKISVVKISPDSKFVAIGDNEGLIIVCSLPQMKLIHSMRYHKKAITYLLYDLDHESLISGSEDKKIAVWDLNSGTKILEINDFKDVPRSLALSPNGRTLAACGDRKEVYLWEYPIGKLKTKLEGHKKDLIFLDFNADGTQLLSIGKDKNCIIWDLNIGKPARKIEINPHIYENSEIEITSACSGPYKDFFAVGVQERVLQKGASGMGGLSNLSPKHDMIFEHQVAFYDWKTGAEIEILPASGKSLDYIAITPDKNYIVVDNSTLKKNGLAFMDIQRGTLELAYETDGEVSAIDISNDGKWMTAATAAGSDNSESLLNLWSLEGVEGYYAGNEGVVKAPAGPFGPTFRITTSDQPLLESKNPEKVAVLYFDEAGVTPGIGKGVTHSIEAQLANSSSVILLERNRIDAVLDELKLQASGLTAPQAAKVGNLLNAEYVLIGVVSKKGNSMSIVAKLVDVGTSEIAGIREVQAEDAAEGDFDKMISILGPTLAKSKK